MLQWMSWGWGSSLPVACGNWRVSLPAALVLWQTQIATDLECQHPPSLGVWLTEPHPCLDHWASFTPPCTRFGNSNCGPVRGPSFLNLKYRLVCTEQTACHEDSSREFSRDELAWARVKFEQIPLFYPRGWAAQLLSLGAAQRAQGIAQAVMHVLGVGMSPHRICEKFQQKIPKFRDSYIPVTAIFSTEIQPVWKLLNILQWQMNRNFFWYSQSSQLGQSLRWSERQFEQKGGKCIPPPKF